MEFTKEILEGKVGVLIESVEQSALLCHWISKNLGSKYNDYNGVYNGSYGEDSHIGKVVYCNHKYGNIFEFDRKHYAEEKGIKIMSFEEAKRPDLLKAMNRHCPSSFGFEPKEGVEIYFECKKGWLYGKIEGFAHAWNKITGGCFDLEEERFRKYDLEPIKKPWYEDESNFPCVVTYLNKNKEVQAVASGYDKKLGYLFDDRGNDIEEPCMCRPATEEEVLSLLAKDSHE